MQSDCQLVQAVLAGRTAAYAQLVARYERAVLGAAMQVLHDLNAAEDATQDAFTAAYEHLGRLRQPAAFGGWVIRIARRRAVWVARQRRRHASLEAAAAVAAPGRNGLLDEQQRRLLAAVMRLPEHERTIIVLRHFQGHEVAAIAGITGRPVGTVTKQLSRAHARLREWLGDAGP